jgi:TRAP-type C4-dicarboxylate transport system permease small subunit
MKQEKLINTIIPNFIAGMLLLLTALTFLQVVLREFYNFGLPWIDEVSRFSMIWVGLFGSIWITKNNQHLNVGLRLHKKLNKKLVDLIDGLSALFIAVIALVAAYQTAIFAFMSMSTSSSSLGWLKLGYVFIALPLAMLALTYYYLKSFLKNFRRTFKKN